MKKSFLLSIYALCFVFFNSLNAQGLVSHDFNDGDMGPFVSCTTQSPNYTRVVNNRLRTYWTESSYNSSNRMTKGAEGCGDPSINGIGYLTYKHCWAGFTMNIDEAYMGSSYTGVGSLAQIFGFNDDAGQFSWTALLEIENGDLKWIDRRGMGSVRADVVVYENFPKGVDMDIILHAVLSDNGTGVAEVFVNGELKYSAYNIRIGMGEFDSNDVQTNTSYTEFKIGQYNHSGAANNEVRIVDYDNISWYDGKDGYAIVDPSGGNIPVDDCGDFDAYSTIQAEDYCDQSGIQLAGNAVGYIQNGDWIKFNDVDFGNGAVNFEARVSSGNAGGDIELRLGSASGTIIGTCEVDGTGSWTTWDTESCTINGVSGVKDLYLVFTGGSGYLLDVDWFKFTEGETTTGGDFTPDPNKVYYIDAPHHNLRLAADGNSDTPEATSTNTTGADVEWKFVDRGNGYWHIQRAAGGTMPRLRTDQNEEADMQPTSSSGTWTYFDFTEGAIANTYFITLPNVSTEFKRLQIDNTGSVNMVGGDRNGTWESFKITEVSGGSNSGTCDLPWTQSNFEVTDQTVNNTSEVIDISCASNVSVSIDLNSVGNMEDADYLNIYYKVDGGSQQVLSENRDSFSAKTVSVDGINGDSLELIFQSFTSHYSETYFVSNIQVKSSTSNKVITAVEEVYDVTIYPNPVTSETVINNAANSILNVYDVNGKVVFSKDISSESEVINFNKLTSGIYYTEVLGETTKYVVKIVKE